MHRQSDTSSRHVTACVLGEESTTCMEFRQYNVMVRARTSAKTHSNFARLTIDHVDRIWDTHSVTFGYKLINKKKLDNLSKHVLIKYMYLIYLYMYTCKV
jgi:hypothetical protein